MASDNVPDKNDLEKARRAIEDMFENNDLTQMTEAAVGMHEIYLGYRAGGFTEYQALWLIGYMVTGGSGREISDEN